MTQTMAQRKLPGSASAMALLMALACGCSSPPELTAEVRNHALAVPTPAHAASVMPAEPASAPPTPLVEPVSLDGAVAYAWQHHPALHEAVATYLAAVGRVDQSWRPPNPRLHLMLNDAPIDSRNSFLADAKYALRWEQELAISGRLATARDAAEADQREAAIGVAKRWREVYRDVLMAYVGVDLARRRLEVARGNYELAQRVRDLIRRQVAVGASPVLHQHRADVALHRTHVAVTRAEREYRVARQDLAVAIGMPPGRLPAVLPPPVPDTTPPALSRLVADLEAGHPVMLEAIAGARAAQARIAHADALGNIDLTATAGVRYVGQTDTAELHLGVSFPLPVHDRNQGNRHAARADHAGALAHVDRLRLELAGALASAHAATDAHLAQWREWTGQVLPAARSAVEAAEAGYRQGGFSELDVLQAQQEYFRARDDALDDLGRLWRSAVDLHALCGNPAVFNPLRVSLSASDTPSDPSPAR